MFDIGSQGIGTVTKSALTVAIPESVFDWDISLYYGEGGRKRVWLLGQDNSPINKITFELNEHICGAGSIEFSYIDFPIDPDDYILIRYKGKNIYRGLIDNVVDPKGGKIKLQPYSVRFGELLIDNIFTGQTIEEILETVIDTIHDDTKINWIAGLVDIDDTETFTLDYSGLENPKKIIDELVKKLDDRFWGVDANNNFWIYTPDTNISQTFLYGSDPKYTDITETTNWSKIKATRYQVFKKNTTDGGETEYIGDVGFDIPGGDYPILPVEDKRRKMVAKYTVSEVVTSDTEALDIAYNGLIANTQTPQNIKVNNFDVPTLIDLLSEIPIRKKITVQDREEYIQRTIIECNALTDDDTCTTLVDGSWSGVTLDSTDFIDGDASVTFSEGSAIYDFGSELTFKDPITLGFMIKGTISGEYLEFSTGTTINGWSSGAWSSGAWSENTTASDELWQTTRDINIFTGSVWIYVDVEIISDSFRYFGLRFKDSTASTINLDRVQMYVVNRSEYTSNIIKVPITLMGDGVNSTVELNKYNLQANDVFFADNRRIEKLESITQAN